ncbi:MAG: hypothetical protein ACRDM1_14775, partial [Gaiellaceae bacterium]
RRYIPLGIGFGLCSLGLSAVPPFGTFLGKALVEQAAVACGYAWVPALLTIGTLLVAAALARAGARIFLGLGSRRDPLLARQAERASEGEPGEDEEPPRQLPLLLPAYVFLVVALGLAFVPTLAGRSLASARHDTDRAAYAAEILHGRSSPPPRRLPQAVLSPGSYAYGAASAAAALALAGLMLFRRRLPRLGGVVPGPLRAAVEGTVETLHTIHSGALGDYVTWLALGVSAIAGIWALTLA